MPVWICAVVGVGEANALPGTAAVAVAAISPAGAVARWQVSHVVDDGMCELDPTGVVAGITMMRPTPAKLDPASLAAYTTVASTILNLDETITKE